MINNFSGFSLIEVLISLLLMSCILLGFDGIQIYSLRDIRTAYYYHLAINQLNSMSERLQSLGKHKGINEQISLWNLENQALLPQGTGKVLGLYPNYVISIFWGATPSTCSENHPADNGCAVCHLKL